VIQIQQGEAVSEKWEKSSFFSGIAFENKLQEIKSL